ncbi:unnamed protein product [Orchesella dallaii]|uniref:Uncharacterized protein n=1 Tax=Orchesella dallaii TaxID=48710 RepID=A0ABP1S401_9HEXA
MFSNFIFLVIFPYQVTFSNSEVYNVVTGSFEKLLRTAKIPNESIDQRLFPPTPNKIPVPTTNLNEFLIPFRNCFVILTNFQGVDLLPTKYPIIIREPKIALLRSGNINNFILVHKTMQPSVNSSDFHSACTSSLFSDADSNPCIALKYEDFMRKTKPLKCQVNINLYPQDYLLTYPNQLKMPLNTASYIKFPLTFHHNLTYNSRIKASSQPFNFLITNDTNEPLLQEKLAFWIYSFAHNPYNYDVQLTPSRDLFLHVSTEFLGNKQTIVSIATVTMDILTKNVLKDSVSLHKIPFEFFKLPLESITLKAAAPYTNNVVNVNDNFRYKGPVIRKLSDKIRRIVCNKNPYSFVSYFKLVSSDFYKTSVLNNLVNELAIMVTQMIIPNATFVYNHHLNPCKNIALMPILTEYNYLYHSGIKVNVKTFEPHKFANLPLQMNNPMKSLKFISCGKPTQKSFGFSEFVTIFQWDVWLIIVIIILLLFPIVFYTVEMTHIKLSPGDTESKNSQSKFSFNLFLQPFVILLEEGEAFTENNLQLSGLRWMLGSLLLAATVLSNAYKYDNVYNVIAPKKFVTYQKIGQLVTDRFEIYTLLSIENSKISGQEPWPMKNVSQKSSHQLQGYLFKMRRNGHLNSEVFSLNKGLEWNVNGTSNDSSVALANSKLHPRVGQIVEELGRVESNRHYFFAGQVFMEQQWKLLTDELKLCNRTALITKELFAIKMAQKLKREIGLKYVFVGTDYLFMEQMAIELYGWIPINIWGNLEALKTSGIWKWWSNVIIQGNGDGKYRGTTSEMVVEKPTIDGNVIIIFYLFLVTSDRVNQVT